MIGTPIKDKNFEICSDKKNSKQIKFDSVIVVADFYEEISNSAKCK